MATNNFKYAQLQPFTLSGSGAVIGATSITLQSMTDIDGNALTMAGTFGTKGFGTLEPGNGILEEQISFTGLTNNANETVTLTGVSSVSFVYPYTETSGLLKTHAGSTTFVISNTAGFYNEVVSKNDDATLTGTLTFTVPNYPQVDNSATMPTLQAQLATKAYVDSVVIGGSPNATTSVQGLVQLPTQAQVDAGTATGSTGASLTPTPALLRSKLLSDYVIDTGAVNAYVITPSPAISAYATGQIFTWKSTNTNTTTSTINVNGKGAKTIKKLDGATNLVAGDIVSGQLVMVEYDGTNFQMLSVPTTLNVVPAFSSSQINEFITTTDGAALSFGRPFDYQVFTGNGTWTKPTNLSGNEMVFVQCWGGGGSGGGAASGSAGGGGGGGYTEERYRASDLTSTVSVTIGAGGTAGTAGEHDGNPGGATTFGSFVSAAGGLGGIKGGTTTGGSGGAGFLGNGTGIYAGGVGGSGVGPRSTFGGAAGGAGTNGGGNAGGAAYFGGGGGGGGASGGAGGAGGAGKTGYGGAGGDGGGGNPAAGNASVALAGGGGGGASNGGGSVSGGVGFRGECRVWTLY